jgi:hypothetical protein
MIVQVFESSEDLEMGGADASSFDTGVETGFSRIGVGSILSWTVGCGLAPLASPLWKAQNDIKIKRLQKRVVLFSKLDIFLPINSGAELCHERTMERCPHPLA